MLAWRTDSFHEEWVEFAHKQLKIEIVKTVRNRETIRYWKQMTSSCEELSLNSTFWNNEEQEFKQEGAQKLTKRSLQMGGVTWKSRLKIWILDSKINQKGAFVWIWKIARYIILIKNKINFVSSDESDEFIVFSFKLFEQFL